jgi:hypothetical protein
MANTGVEYVLSLKDLFTSKIKAATNQTEKLNGAVGKTQRAFSSLGAAVGVGVGIAGVVGFGKAVVDSLKNYEYFSSSLRTLMHGDAQTAKALETQLVSLAAKTPFSLVEIQDATKQLLAYGFSANTVTKNISMLGDVASGLKIPFGDIAYLYGTLRTQGRAFTKDIMQFTQRGIPVISELAKQFKITDGEVMKLVEDGKIGFAEVEKAFQSMTAEGGMFFNMMAEQTATVGGQLSALGDNYEQLKVNIGKSQTGIIASSVKFANDFVSILSNMFARSNQEAEYFAKYGAEKFSLKDYFDFDSSGNNVTSQFARFQNTLNKIYVETPAKTLTESKNKFNELRNLLKNQKVAFDKGEIDLSEYKRNRAAILGTMDQVKGGFDLMANPLAPKGKAAQTATDVAKQKGGTSTSAVESRGVQNFNISIKSLVETLQFTTNNMKESGAVLKEEVAKALIEAVNDFQLMATK